MNVAVRRRIENDFKTQETQGTQNLAAVEELDVEGNFDPESSALTTKFREAISGTDGFSIEGLPAGADLSKTQVELANKVIANDPTLVQLLGLDTRIDLEGTKLVRVLTPKLTGPELAATLESLSPTERELATSMLAYNFATNAIEGQTGSTYAQLFRDAFGGEDLPKFKGNAESTLEHLRGGRKDDLTATEVAQLFKRPATFEAEIRALSASGNKDLARDLIEANLDLPQDKRNQLLLVTGLDAHARYLANEEQYATAQDPAMRDAALLYRSFGGTTELASSEFIAAGDGTGTNALLNEPNRGVGFFKYALDPVTGQVQAQNRTSITPASESTSMLLDLKGINHAGGTVVLDVGGHELTLMADAQHPVLGVVGTGDFTKTQDPAKPSVDIYRAGDLEIQHDTKTNIFTVFDAKERTIDVALTSNLSKGDRDEVALGVYATKNPTYLPPLELDLGLTDAYELGSWKLDEAKVDAQFEAGLSDEERATLKKHFASGGVIELTVAGHGIGHVENGKVVDGASADQKGPNQGARYSGVEAELVRDGTTYTLEVDVDSFTDDVPAAGIRARLTPEGQVMFDKLLAEHPTLDPNDVLSGLRSFSMVKHLTELLVDNGDLSPAEAEVALKKTSVTLDDGAKISYADFRRMTGG